MQVKYRESKENLMQLISIDGLARATFEGSRGEMICRDDVGHHRPASMGRPGAPMGEIVPG